MTRKKLLVFGLVDAGVSICLAIAFRSNTVLAGLVHFVLHPWPGIDSKMYMDMAWDVWKSGAPIYQVIFFQQHFKFIYPSSSLLLYSLANLIHINPDTVLGVVVLLSWAGVVFWAGELMILKMSEHGKALPISRNWIRCFAGLVSILFFPLLDARYLGQIQTLLTALWILAVILWMKGWKGSAGLSLALICAFKPVLAVFVIWALLRKEWKFLGVFVGAAALIQVISIAIFGWRNELDYLSVLSYISRHGEAYIHNQSFNGLMQRWLGNGDMATWQPTIYPPYRAGIYLSTLATTAALLLFGLVVPLMRRWNDRTLDFILFGMISTVASPIAWEHHYSYFLVVMLYVLASESIDLKQLVFLGSCFLIVGNVFPFYFQLQNTRWNPLISTPYFAGLGMIAGTVAILERTRSKPGVMGTE